MSGVDDVWRPTGEDAPAPAPVAEGRAAYGEGVWINQAFSLEVAFRIAFGLLRERPGLVLGAGALIWFAFDLPTFASLPMSVASGVIRASGGAEDTAMGLDLAGNLTTLIVYALVFPVQWILVAGALKALARHVEGEPAPTRLLWTSWREGLIAMVYRVLTVVIVSFVMAVVLLPAAALSAVLVVLEHAGIGAVLFAGAVLVALFAYLYVILPLFMGIPACAIDGAGPLEALQIAWRAGSGARATLFVFGLVFGLLSLAGTCLFCVGQIPVFGLLMAAVAGGWLLYARSPETLGSAPFFERNPVEWL